MKKKVKVLFFVDRMRRGGIQSLVVDWISRFDKEKIQIDVLLLDDGEKYELEGALENLGCTVYKLKGIWLNCITDFIKYASRLNSFFREHNDYQIVHLHSSSKNYMVLKYAKKYGIPVRIAHSHNIDFQTTNPIKKIIGKLFKYPLIKYSTDYFACSKPAGQWLFGKKIVNSPKFKIVHNAIDYNKFKFDDKSRRRIRKELLIGNDDIVLGHAGRFTNQKNHKFLIEIFYEYSKHNPYCKLLLIGAGELETEIKEKVKSYNLEKKVIFTGFKSNVNEYMQAMDVFVFPSLYEGLGLVLIEAQASGIPCFTSGNKIPTEAKVTDLLHFISLKKDAKYWADKILSANIERKDTYQEIKSNGYLIDDVVSFLEKEYKQGVVKCKK